MVDSFLPSGDAIDISVAPIILIGFRWIFLSCMVFSFLFTGDALDSSVAPIICAGFFRRSDN